MGKNSGKNIELDLTNGVQIETVMQSHTYVSVQVHLDGTV